MNLIRTIDDGKLLRIEEKGGSEVTVKFGEDKISLLTLYVPEEDRRDGMATILMSIVEREAELRGITLSEAAFSSEIPGLYDFIRSAGYTVEEVTSVLTADLKNLLKAPGIKTLNKTPRGIEFIPIKDFTYELWREFFGFLYDMGIRTDTWDFDEVVTEISGVVVDSAKRVCGCSLFSVRKDNLNLDMLETVSNDKDKIVFLLLKGAIVGLLKGGGISRYNSFSLVPTDPDVHRYMATLLGDEFRMEHTATVYTAKKKLSYNAYDYEMEERSTKDPDSWLDTFRSIPYQSNISMKMDYAKYKE